MSYKVTIKALALLCSTVSADATILVGNDSGGKISTYRSRVEHVRSSGEAVIIFGQCNSACTIWLTLPYDQRCVRPNTTFTFHNAVNELGLPAPQETLALWMSYPDKVKIAVGSRGGLTTSPVRVPGHEVAKACR